MLTATFRSTHCFELPGIDLSGIGYSNAVPEVLPEIDLILRDGPGFQRFVEPDIYSYMSDVGVYNLVQFDHTGLFIILYDKTPSSEHSLLDYLTEHLPHDVPGARMSIKSHYTRLGAT